MESTFKIKYKIEERSIPELYFVGEGKPRDNIKYVGTTAYSPVMTENVITQYKVYHYNGRYWEFKHIIDNDYYARWILPSTSNKPKLDGRVIYGGG